MSDAVLELPDDLDLDHLLPKEAQAQLRPEQKNPIIEHAKQGLAGVTDAFTGLPTMLGMGKSAVEAGYSAATSDKKFIPEFSQNMENSDLIKAGESGRKAVNDFLGIEDPKTGTELATRLLTSAVLPIPGSLAESALGKTAAFLTPVIKTELPLLSKGNAIRYGAQEAMNFGVDQLARGMRDEPLIWQTDANAPPQIDLTPQADGSFAVGGDFTFPSEFDPEGADLDRAMRERDATDTLKTLGVVGGLAVALLGYGKAAEMMARTKRPPTGFDTVPSANETGVDRTAKEILTSNNPMAVLKQQADDMASQVVGKYFNQNEHIARELTNIGEDPSLIERMGAQEAADSTGRGIQRARDMMHDIVRDYEALTPERQQIFNDGLIAHYADIQRTRATINDALKKDTNNTLDSSIRDAFNANDTQEMRRLEALYSREIAGVRGTSVRERPSLWKKDGNPVPDQDIRAATDALFSDQGLSSLAHRLVAVNDRMLDYLVSSGVKTRADADFLRKGFTSERGLIYIPGKEDIGRASWLKRLAEVLGIHTSSGKDLRDAGNFHAMGLTEGEGIKSPLAALNSSLEYLIHVQQYRDRNVAMWNHLTRLGGVVRDAATGNIIQRIGGPGRSTMSGSFPGQKVHYAGLADREGNITWAKGNDTVKKALLTQEGVLPKSIDQAGDKLLWVEHQGQFHGFYVTDKGLATALEFTPALHNNFEKFWATWKNRFTQLTTGTLSPFAPISFMYQQQMAMINASARGGLKAGTQAWADAAKGAWKMFAGNVSRDLADQFAAQVNRNLGLAAVSPQMAVRMRDFFQRIFENSLVDPVRREAGAFSTSLSSNNFLPSVTTAMEEAIPHISKTFGSNVLPQLVRTWRHLNQALHEGTAYGLMLRKLEAQGGVGAVRAGTLTGDEIRQSMKEVKDITGDVRLVGSSPVARMIHASVPFSGSMFQSWYTIGKAIKANPKATLAALSSFVAAPAAIELTWNHVIPDDQQWPDPTGQTDKVWTYKDYYWNGFTTDQRNNNAIFFIPGKPPWEALLVPIVPELSLVRSVMIEGMDAIFGLSQIGKTDAAVTGQNGWHFLAALTRVFDIPVPPPLAAAVSAKFGVDLRIGPHFDDNGFSLVTAQPYSTGEKLTSKFGQEKFVNQEIDTRTTAVIQDLLGAGGSLATAVYEAFNAGKADDPQPSLMDRAAFAGGEGLNILAGQAKITQPIFGKAIHPNANNEISSEVFKKKETITRLEKDFKSIIDQGAMAGQLPNTGNSIVPTNDPIAFIVASNIPALKERLQPWEKFVADLRTMKSNLGNATRWDIHGDGVVVPISAKQRKDLMDGLEAKIAEYKANQALIYRQHEAMMSVDASTKMGRDVVIDLSNFSARPNLRQN